MLGYGAMINCIQVGLQAAFKPLMSGGFDPYFLKYAYGPAMKGSICWNQWFQYGGVVSKWDICPKLAISIGNMMILMNMI